jgi:hypothetical protein
MNIESGRAERTERTNGSRELMGPQGSCREVKNVKTHTGSAWFSIATATRFCGEPLLHSSWFLLETAAWSTGVVNALPGIHTS